MKIITISITAYTLVKHNLLPNGISQKIAYNKALLYYQHLRTVWNYYNYKLSTR